MATASKLAVMSLLLLQKFTVLASTDPTTVLLLAMKASFTNGESVSP